MALLRLIGPANSLVPPEVAGTGPSVITDAGSSTGFSIQPDALTTDVQIPWTIPVETDICHFGGWFYIPAGATKYSLFHVGAGNTDRFRFDCFNGTMTVGGHNQSLSAAALDWTVGAFTYPEAEWFYMEASLKIADAGGYAEVRLNGQQSSYSGDTRRNFSAQGTPRTFFIAPDSGEPSAPKMHSFWVCDDVGSAPHNALLGVGRVEVSAVDTSGQSDFTGSDADQVDNHLMVDEGDPPDTIDYIESSTVTDVQELGIEAQVLAGTPIAMKVIGYGRDTDAGSAQIEFGIRSNVSDDVGVITLPDADGLFSHIVPIDPDGSVVWDTAARDAAEVKIEVV